MAPEPYPAPAAPEAAKPPETPLPPETRYAQGHVVILTHGDEAEAQSLLKEAVGTLSDLKKLLKLTPSDTLLTIHLFDTRPILLAYMAVASPGPVDSDAVCFYTPQGGVIALARQSNPQETLRLLRHQVAGFAVTDRFLEAPPWIREGLAFYFESGPPYGLPNDAALDQLRGEAEERMEGALAALVNVPPQGTLDAKGVARAWALTQFLMTQTEDGPAAMKKYLDQVHVGEPPVAQFAHAFGVPPSELEPAWRLYLAQMAAPAKNGD